MAVAEVVDTQGAWVDEGLLLMPRVRVAAHCVCEALLSRIDGRTHTRQPHHNSSMTSSLNRRDPSASIAVALSAADPPPDLGGSPHLLTASLLTPAPPPRVDASAPPRAATESTSPMSAPLSPLVSELLTPA
eukprot:CAMPEP_0183331792 /NCGR_PEP_ID=MMETSP0164_2-20130417/1119_1 /TAXON_ID=221442 /ORGANISM="Coccolithus pelagicus ssp braarudi, Strain PLY182g" /LENGTH=131 /DNA_ID=CAMNT_0025500369 /DNA_START=294 /DNA_END=687 /DNA_ORIENTATION=+